MKEDLKSKLIDGLLAAAILMVVMYPLIILFRYLEQWGTVGYVVMGFVFWVAAIWMLYRATLGRLSEVGRSWYGLIGGLFAWSLTEISHSSGLIYIENYDILLMLALVIGFLVVMWKFFPVGARFWIVIFMMNWVGHVYIHLGEHFLSSDAARMLFTISTGGYALFLIGTLYWLFARSTTRVQRLWCALFIWNSLALMYFLMR